MKKGLIGVQMSTIAPAKMPSFDAFDAMKKLTDIGYHCIEISQVPMTPENVAGFQVHRRAWYECFFLHRFRGAHGARHARRISEQPGRFQEDC